MVSGVVIARPKFDGLVTFQMVGEQWTSGALHQQWPDYIRKKKTSDDDKSWLTHHVYRYIGHFPIATLELTHFEEVMRKCPLTEASSCRHVAQVMHRIMVLATYPLRLIPSNPIPTGFLPKVSVEKARAFLYPAEDAQLLGCREVSAPLSDGLWLSGPGGDAEGRGRASCLDRS